MHEYIGELVCSIYGELLTPLTTIRGRPNVNLGSVVQEGLKRFMVEGRGFKVGSVGLNVEVGLC